MSSFLGKNLAGGYNGHIVSLLLEMTSIEQLVKDGFLSFSHSTHQNNVGAKKKLHQTSPLGRDSVSQTVHTVRSETAGVGFILD